ncbi:MAG: 50S ribosomal protein L18 [Planctomycetota bacterium]
MKSQLKKHVRALRRRRHVRRMVRGTGERPRLTVFRSHKNIYCQIIDDAQHKTLVSCSSRDKDIQDPLQGLDGGKTKVAELVGEKLAEKAKAQGIEKVAFDRGSYKYHGRVKAVAEGARKGGLNF